MGTVAVLLTLTWGPLFIAELIEVFVKVDSNAFFPSRWVEPLTYTMFPLVFLGAMIGRMRENFRATQQLREDSTRPRST